VLKTQICVTRPQCVNNLGNWSLCHRRHEIQTCNSYCLSPLCPRQFNTTRKLLLCYSALPVSVIVFLFPRWPQHDSLSLPGTRATRKRRAKKLGRCYQPERPFCTLARYSLPSRTASFTYMCLSAQVSGEATRVHAGRWHAGSSLIRKKRERAYKVYLYGCIIDMTSSRMVFVEM
jgi:hypothetical protein